MKQDMSARRAQVPWNVINIFAEAERFFLGDLQGRLALDLTCWPQSLS